MNTVVMLFNVLLLCLGDLWICGLFFYTEGFHICLFIKPATDPMSPSTHSLTAWRYATLNWWLSLLLQHCPVEHVIIRVVKPSEYFFEKVAKVGVVRGFLEAHVATVCDVGTEFLRETVAKRLRGCSDFSLTDSFVFLFFVRSPEALPRELRYVEVHENVPEGF